jgi:hypothetical protein
MKQAGAHVPTNRKTKPRHLDNKKVKKGKAIPVTSREGP